MQSLHTLALTSLFAAGLFATSLASQTNPFVFYPQDPERQQLTCTSFVGRPDMSARAEALMEVDPEHFRGVGDANTISILWGVYHWLADEKLNTIETYDVVVRTGDPLGPGPDMSAAAELVRITNLTSPPSQNPNRGTWIIRDGFGIVPVITSVSPSRYYVGVDLPANPLWPATDGHSLFRADLLNAGTGATVGENHRAIVPRPTWAGRLANPSFPTPWTYVLGPLVTSPNLHLGGLDPTSFRLGAPGANFSMNGLFPDISGTPRLDGLKLRITDNIAPFGVVLLGGSIGFRPPFLFSLGGGILIGNSHIGDAVAPPVMLGFGALQVGAFEIQLAAPGTLGPAQIGFDLAFQAIVWDVNTNVAQWTNAQEVHL